MCKVEKFALKLYGFFLEFQIFMNYTIYSDKLLKSCIMLWNHPFHRGFGEKLLIKESGVVVRLLYEFWLIHGLYMDWECLKKHLLKKYKKHTKIVLAPLMYFSCVFCRMSVTIWPSVFRSSTHQARRTSFSTTMSLPVVYFRELLLQSFYFSYRMVSSTQSRFCCIYEQLLFVIIVGP